jgi:8-oxo-dGTP pyrophosphatase MutT (NUDIX family)/phosphohistidine phosphatase SixA
VAPDVTETLLAAGGVLWRDTGAEVEIAVVHRPRYDDWSLPKGTAKPGEHLVRCAIREVGEETGFEARAGRCLGELVYPQVVDGRSVRKVVRYWEMRCASGFFLPGAEVDELRWLPVARAREALSYPRDREPVDAFAAAPAATTTVALVRHGSAGNRDLWEAGDETRPLDDLGGTQAVALAEMLPCYGVRRIVSAPLLRCVETVRPLADALGVPVDTEPLFSEAGHRDGADLALDRLRAIAGEGVPAVVSSQGGVVPDLVERLHAADGVTPPDAVRARKGSAWVLSFDGRRLVASDYQSRP